MNKDIKLDTLLPGRNYIIQARYRINNKNSAWSPALTFKTINDDGAPKVPSKPVVKDYLGTLIISWDGKAFDGSKMDNDFDFVEVHAGDTTNFVPSGATLNTTIRGAFAQETAISGLPFKVIKYIKFIAVDVAGNKSAPSDSTGGTPKKVTGDALDNLAVEVANINFSARDIGATFAYYQDEPPTTGMKEKDVWYDTNDGYKQYVYANGQWKDVKSAAADAADQIARDKADQALASANGKNKITYSLNIPGSTVGTSPGDVWFQRNADGNIIAQYEWTGSVWISRQVDNAVIANLDAGKITAGTISADRIGARSLTADKVVIGDVTNFVLDPNLLLSNSFGYGTNNTRLISSDASVPSGSPGQYVVRFTCASTVSNIFYQTGRPIGSPVSPGDVFYVECWMRATSDATNQAYLSLSTHDANGADNKSIAPFFASASSYQGWTKYSGQVTVPANHYFMTLVAGISAFNGTPAGSWFMTGFKLRKATETTTIVDGAITTSKITANSLNADRITSGTITTDKIGANQITGAKIAAGAITAGSAIIGSAAIDSAQIGSLEVGKLTSGTLNAVVTVSNRIQTSTGYPSVDMTSTGLRLFNSSGTATVILDSQSGNGSFNGDMIAKTWFSRNYINGGGYIQIGNSNLNEDNNDEVRFFVSNGAVALRSPTAYPGRFRVSVRDSGFNTRVFDFDATKGIIANRFTMGDQSATYPFMESYYAGSSGTWIRTVFEGGYNLYFGSVENSHSWIANDRVAIALLGSSLNQINFRNSNNTAYCNIQANTAYFSSLYVNGTQVTGSGGSGGNANYANSAGYASSAGTADNALSAQNYSQTLNIAGAEAPLNSVIMRVGSGSFVRIQTHNGPASAGLYVNGPFGAYGSKSFIIPHPLDSDKWLMHAATESPTPGLEYWGDEVLDGEGKAVVYMPRYFEVLTRKLHRAVFLQSLDGASPATPSRVIDGEFTIQGEPNSTVHWMVKADRDDVSFQVEPRVDAPGLPSPDHLYNFDDDDEQQWQRAKAETEAYDQLETSQ